jgi:hypothetical protein
MDARAQLEAVLRAQIAQQADMTRQHVLYPMCRRHLMRAAWDKVRLLTTVAGAGLTAADLHTISRAGRAYGSAVACHGSIEAQEKQESVEKQAAAVMEAPSDRGALTRIFAFVHGREASDFVPVRNARAECLGRMPREDA